MRLYKSSAQVSPYRKLNPHKMRTLWLKIIHVAIVLAVVVYEKHIASVADAEQLMSDCRCQRRG